MLSQPDGPFINLSKINFAKYAKRPNLSKVPLLCYIFFAVKNSVILADYTRLHSIYICQLPI